VIDEAALVPDALLAALRPMVATSNGKIWALTTPSGARGWFYELWTGNNSDWYKVRVSADQCPRISKAFLESELRELDRPCSQPNITSNLSTQTPTLLHIHDRINCRSKLTGTLDMNQHVAPLDRPLIPAVAKTKWVVGVDLGQSIDFTAICALRHTAEPL
jgi:hypothetical protein